jgi:anti-sigma regulatory factor (Ser/Thr protein kinase)
VDGDDETELPGRRPRGGPGAKRGECVRAPRGADPETRAAIALCVSEAVTNAIVHAYRHSDAPGVVEVEAHRPNGYLCINCAIKAAA